MGCQGPLDEEALTAQTACRTELIPFYLDKALTGRAAGRNRAGLSGARRAASRLWLAIFLPLFAGTAMAAADEPIDRQPYRIELHLAFDPSARIDAACRSVLLKEWQSLVRRLVGPPWIITIASQPSPLASGDLESLQSAAFARFDPAFDKIWLIRVSAA